MGRQKVRLNWKDGYALLAATERALDIIIPALRDLPGPSTIRLEDEGSQEWDDILVKDPTRNRRDYWQIKRHTTPLTNDILQALLKQAAQLSTEAKGEERFFHLGVSDLVDIHFKDKRRKPISLKTLRDMCLACQVKGFSPTTYCTNATKEELKWLKFVRDSISKPQLPDAAIILSHISIELLGCEQDIQKRAASALSPFFEDETAALNAIRLFLHDNASDSSDFDYHSIYNGALINCRRSITNSHWFGIRFNPTLMQWSQAGSVGLGEFVERLWSDTAGAITFRLHAVPDDDRAMSHAITRLLIHRKNGTIETANPSSWSSTFNHLTAGTLGLQDGDSPGKTTNPVSSTGASNYPSSLSPNTFSEALQKQMDDACWNALGERVGRVLADNDPRIEPTLREEMKALWRTWHQSLTDNPDSRYAFLCNALVSTEEFANKSVKSRVRLGIRTTELLSEGIEVLLAVAVTLNNPHPGAPADGSVNNLSLAGQWLGHLIVLRRLVSGERICKVSFEPSWLLKEPALVVLSGTEVPSKTISTLASTGRYDKTIGSQLSMSSPGIVPALITNDAEFQQALKEGASAIASHVSKHIQQASDNYREQLIAAVTSRTEQKS